MPRTTRILAVCAAAAVAGCVHDTIRLAPSPEPVVALDTTAIRQTLLFMGDAGEAHAGDPSLRALRAAADERPERTTILFLGDNVYDDGLPDSTARDFAAKAAVLRAQVEASGRARVVFLPGNHDWNRQDKVRSWTAGPPTLGREARFVAREAGTRATFA